MLLRELKESGEFPKDVIYTNTPYVIMSNEGCVLWSGSKEELLNGINTTSDSLCGTYYDDCELKAREHDIYLADNSKVL